MEKLFDIAVVGSGAAGSMGVLRSVLNNLETVCFTGNALTKKRARATWVGNVENMPVLFNYPKAIFQSANEVYQWIDKHDPWNKLLTSVKDEVVKISGEKGNFLLETKDKGSYRAKHVVLCTGIADVQPEIQGHIKPVFPMANAGYIEYCIRCDGHRTLGKKVAIIGHAESAAGIAALLIERYGCPKMAIVTNGKRLEITAGSPVAEKIEKYGITVHTSPILEVLGDPKKDGLTGFKLADGSVVDAQIAFVALGSIVYNRLAVELGAKVDERGYVLSDEFGETNVPGIFVGGDLRANKKKQIYTAWDITVDAVDRVDSFIRAERRAALLAK